MNPLYFLMPIAGLVGYRTIKALSLKNWQISDFRGLHMFLSTEVMEKVDLFAEHIKPDRVIVSPAKGTIVRFSTKEVKNKDHFYGRAIDVMLVDGTSLYKAYQIALKSGFNAIGVYPFWQPYKGLHLAIRPPLDHIRKWSDMGKGGVHKYVEIERGFTYG